MAVNVKNADFVLGNVSLPTTVIPAVINPNQVTLLKGTVFNSDTASHIVNVYRVPPGGNTSTVLPMCGQIAVGANETVVLPLSGQTLVGSQTLQADADLEAVVQISIGYAQTP